MKPAVRTLKPAVVLLVLLILLLLQRPRRMSRAPPHLSGTVHSSAVNNSVFILAAERALLRCPPGRYQGNASTIEAARARLVAHWQRLHSLGYRPYATRPDAVRRAISRGFLTYESSLWPRPAHCHDVPRRLQHHRPLIVDEPPGTCEPAGSRCDKYRLSRDYHFVWHHVWKGGTTSLSPYLSCNMRALPVAGLLHRLPARLPGYLHVGTVRAPVPRFLSAFQEVFTRVRVRHSPQGELGCRHRNVPWALVATALSGGSGGGGHGGGGGRGGAAGGGDTISGSDGIATTTASTIEPAIAQLLPKLPAQGLCTDPDIPLSGAAVRAVFRQFVADVECSTQFANAAHLYSQSLFLGSNTSVPQPIDLLLRLESLERDLQALKRAVGYPPHQQDACPLKTERSASQKPRAVPTASVLNVLLVEEPALLQSLCNVYMQDFVCLGYPLPTGCDLLPSHAARPPPTMDMSANVLSSARAALRGSG